MVQNRPVKIRLEGFPEDLASFAEHLQATPWANVLDYSRPYPNRRGNPERCRVYLEVLIGPESPRPGTSTTVTEIGPDAIAPPPPRQIDNDH
ncbi:hypothetical protein [Nocardiopsis dassonvillei]|uniref:hypothetical protein n=1 Tax=Nocardiopsis dassonvillei TaxID=2014 RepID=UPI00157DC6A4|nr:hypothetical protein [Nocardiopsis dassonvillei]